MREHRAWLSLNRVTGMKLFSLLKSWSIMTDKGDWLIRVYIEPLTLEFISKNITQKNVPECPYSKR